jgi:predicted nucleic acid-binding Zn ribbon protein
MSRSNNKIQPIGEVIREMLNTYHLGAKFDEANVIGAWEKVVGAPVAKRTRQLYIRGKILYIRLDSPSLKNDFLLNKPHVLDLLRKEFGADSVADLVLL